MHYFRSSLKTFVMDFALFTLFRPKELFLGLQGCTLQGVLDPPLSYQSFWFFETLSTSSFSFVLPSEEAAFNLFLQK